MPSIYIAGPMKGYPLYNFPAFDAAAALLASQGWTPINPAQLDRDAGFDPERDPVTPAFLKEAMKRDLDAVQEVDALALLPGWRDSKGAKAEKAVARWRGIPVYELRNEELKPVAERRTTVDIFTNTEFASHWCKIAKKHLKGAQVDCVCARRRFNVVPANDEEARKLAILPGDPRYDTAMFEESFVPLPGA